MSPSPAASSTPTSFTKATTIQVYHIPNKPNNHKKPKKHFEHVEILNELTIPCILVLRAAEHDAPGVAKTRPDTQSCTCS